MATSISEFAGTPDVLSYISHEIRTPMTAVLCASELLLQGPLAQEQASLVGSLRSAAQALLDLVDEALGHAAAAHQAARWQERRFCPRQLAAEVLTLMSPGAQRKQVLLRSMVTCDVPAVLQGDAGALRQILANLLANAIKFTQGGEVVLRLSVTTEAAPGLGPVPVPKPSSMRSATSPSRRGRARSRPLYLEVEVQDSGVGMSQRQVSRLFQPFQTRPGTLGAAETGTGLGLVITRQLVHRMGGQLLVHSAAGQGSCFRAGLLFESCEARPAESRNAARSTRRPLAAGRVLLVDDDPVIRDVIQAMLESLGQRVVCAADGAAALAQLRAQTFSLVLMDCQMPGTNGLAVAEQLRQGSTTLACDEARAWPPLIAMSGSVIGTDRRGWLRAGFDDWLPKPFTKASLTGKLRRWLPDTKRAMPRPATPAMAAPIVA